MHEEILDLVNGQDEVIGMINRKDYGKMVTENLGYIRAAELFIMNDKGELWIPTRPAIKKIAPNGYDYSAAGHVDAGESYVEAMIRETAEEINVLLVPDDIELVAKTQLSDVRYMQAIYLYRSNLTPLYNHTDFTGAEWLAPADIIKRIQAGHPAKSSLVQAIGLLQEYLS